VLPASAWVGLRFGRKRFLMVSIVIFTVASFFCGSAGSLLMILIARLVQGAGGGALQPISQAILTESFPPAKRGLAMAFFGLGVVVAPVIGPTLGGWLTDTYSWRWAFWVNIPVGILALFMIGRFVEDPPYIQHAKPGRLDYWGFGLLALWLGFLQIILDRGQEDDWFGASWIQWGVVIMIIAFVLFVVRQLVIKQPLVDLKIFKNRNFAIGTVLIFMFGAAIYGTVTLLPLYFQTLMGYSATAAGIAVSPRGVGAVLMMPIVGILTSKMDNRYLIACGFGGFGICSLFLAHINPQIGPWSLTWTIILSGAALGMVFVPLSTTALGHLRSSQVGNASGLYNLMRNVGGSIGISLVNTILARHEQVHRTEMVKNLSRYRLPFQQQFTSLTNVFSTRFDSFDAQRKAYGLLERTLDTQSALWSYVDDFRYMALACFLCVPLVFILKKTVRTGAMGAE
jgi:MFS transporter, DHA2 family, multidrug resistance protein